ncbi:hypothetical protein HK405_009731 [Cladochytrium tenue]|nr:hypothetical protein HK405_009731 [Cladochytrium tenue]
MQPAEVTSLPILTGARTTFTSSADVDKQVSGALARGESLYTLDIEVRPETKNPLPAIQPNVILTQDLCDVCAIDLATVARAARRLSPPANVVSLNPLDLHDVLESLDLVGEALGRRAAAAAARAALQARVDAAVERGQAMLDGKGRGRRPNVLFVEWTDPLFPGGHW